VLVAHAFSKVVRETCSSRPLLDAAVVEVHHTGFGVDAGNHHDVVVDVTVGGGVPDGFGVHGRDHLVPLGQILLDPVLSPSDAEKIHVHGWAGVIGWV
jgi:hypothetical protein